MNDNYTWITLIESLDLDPRFVTQLLNLLNIVDMGDALVPDSLDQGWNDETSIWVSALSQCLPLMNREGLKEANYRTRNCIKQGQLSDTLLQTAEIHGIILEHDDHQALKREMPPIRQKYRPDMFRQAERYGTIGKLNAKTSLFSFLEHIQSMNSIMSGMDIHIMMDDCFKRLGLPTTELRIRPIRAASKMRIERGRRLGIVRPETRLNYRVCPKSIGMLVAKLVRFLHEFDEREGSPEYDFVDLNGRPCLGHTKINLWLDEAVVDEDTIEWDYNGNITLEIQSDFSALLALLGVED